MAREEDIDILVTLTGEKDELLLETLLDDAEDFVLSYTNRSKIPSQLWRPVRELATIALNRRGTEGETSRSEGGESYNFDAAPKSIYSVLDRYRLARVGGVAHEAKKI